MAFSDMVSLTFNDKSFAKKMAPVLHEMVLPLLQKTIVDTVSQAVEGIKINVLDKMVESNNKLQETVAIQKSIITKQQTAIEDQKALIEKQEATIKQKLDVLSAKEETIRELECHNKYLTSEVDALKWGLDDLEQYGRRNSIRINNLKLVQSFDSFDNEYDFTQEVLNFINEIVLKGQPPLEMKDIERCHTIGKAKKSRSKQVIVKFARYHDKRRVFMSKPVLKNNKNKTFMTEDLTSANHAVIKSLLPLKKSNKIDSFWTRDGRIFVKLGARDNPIRIKPQENVETRLGIELPGEQDDAASLCDLADSANAVEGGHLYVAVD